MTTFIADEEALETFSDDVSSLWCRREVAVLDKPPDAFTFLRDFVHPSVPCIIRNAIQVNRSTTSSDDAALILTLDDIIDRVGEDVAITVDVTPDGHGDCVRTVMDFSNSDDNNLQQSEVLRQMFVKPYEQKMSIAKFRQLLRTPTYGFDTDEELDTFPILRSTEKSHDDAAKLATNTNRRCAPPVVYYSKQSDCLRNEMKELFHFFPATFSFAEEAFGTGPPDAVNLWIGNERVVSSMHKDFYENLFYVCSGQKEFVLNPPADHLFLYEREFTCGKFSPVGEDLDSGWSITLDENGNGGCSEEVTTKWIEPDIMKTQRNDKFPLLSKSHPIKVFVSEGEMLYIPSLYYHRVTQTCETVGVNYWFDMKFDSAHWCYFNFLQQFSRVEISVEK